jgi:hypothetical protein
MHETGGPVGIAEIASCLDSAGGWVGILPDKIHKPIFTWSSAIRAAQRYGIDFRHWGVVLHSSNAAYVRFQHDLAVSLGVGLIGFPYKARRWEYLDERVLKFEYDQRYHLLGLNERDELEKYATLPGRWSIDTMKLWKVDLTKPGWHGHTRNIEHDDVDIELLKNNVAYLRELFYARSSGGVSTSSTQ